MNLLINYVLIKIIKFDLTNVLLTEVRPTKKSVLPVTWSQKNRQGEGIYLFFYFKGFFLCGMSRQN